MPTMILVNEHVGGGDKAIGTVESNFGDKRAVGESGHGRRGQAYVQNDGQRTRSVLNDMHDVDDGGGGRAKGVGSYAQSLTKVVVHRGFNGTVPSDAKPAKAERSLCAL